MARSACVIEGCDRDNRSRGLCIPHRRLVDRYGDPFYPWEELDRFASKFEIAAEGCWVWRAGRDKDGYGKFRAENVHYRAHRYSWEQAVGPIPDGMVIDHLCRNPPCVNPDHLEVVTTGENVRRGESLAAHNARKTHCKRGHSDWKIPADGYRRCRTCAILWKREHRAQMREAMTYR